MGRKKTARNIYDSRSQVYQFDGIWNDVLGTPEKNGIWLIYGTEKNGKTTFSLQFANYLSDQGIRVWYYSAEEGTGPNFKTAMQRAAVPYNKPLLGFDDYVAIEEIRADLRKKKPAKIVFIDNLTIYADELPKKIVNSLIQEFPKTIFAFLAHEERNKPTPAIAVHCRKLAKIIVHVKGSACTVSGRCPGGKLIIDEEKAAIYHGQD